MGMSLSLGLGINRGGARGVVSWATLHATNYVTAVEMPTSGVYWLRPYDLESMGSEGAALAAANKRYVWFVSSDHHQGLSGFRHGAGVWKGFSDDPGVLPTDWVRAISDTVTVGAPVTGNHNQLETPWLVYNPDDATYPFYLYAHGNTPSDGSRDQETLLFRTADLVAFLTPVVSHSSIQPGGTGHTGYQTVYRTGVNTWVSYGLGVTPSGPLDFASWTSTDGQTFTRSATLTRSISGRTFSSFQGAPDTTLDGQRYSVCREEYVSGVLLPVEADGDLTTTADDDTITATRVFAGVSPTQSFVQGVTGYEEDGIYHMWLRRGYFAGLTAPNKNDWTDYYTFITDATTAADAAPVGVRASCASGVVSLVWYDALPHKNYRVSRSSSASGPWTDLDDVTGLSYTDSSPTLDAVNYYRVTTLNSGEQGNRIVSTYASTSNALANKHTTRALADGADAATIDTAWISTVADWLEENDLTGSVVDWVSPSFGVEYGSAPAVDRIMSLGATIHPYKYRDAKCLTTGSTYSATGVSGSVPGIVNAADTSFIALQDGALNLFRQKDAVTFVSVYNPTFTFDFCPVTYWDNFGVELRHQPGSDRIAFKCRSATTTYTALVSAPDTGDVFAAGVWESDGTITAYCNGTAGTPVAGDLPTAGTARLISGQFGEGDALDVTHPMIGVGTGKWRPSTSAYVTSDSRAKLTFADVIVFSAGLTSTQMDSLYDLMTARLA